MQTTAPCVLPPAAAFINFQTVTHPPAYHQQQHNHRAGTTVASPDAAATFGTPYLKQTTTTKYAASSLPSSRCSDDNTLVTDMFDDSRSTASSEHIRGAALALSPASFTGATPVKHGEVVAARSRGDAAPHQLLPPPAYKNHGTPAGPAARSIPTAPPAYAGAPTLRRAKAPSMAPQAARKPRRHDPYAAPAAPYTPGIAFGISHQPLVGQCRYVAWPEIAPLPLVRAAGFDTSSLPRVVVDQVKFELTGPQLRWIVQHLCGVVPAHVAALDRGAFAVYFATEADSAAASVLHRGLLFDHNGAWAPASATESAAVGRYMGSREFRQRGQRLPRELMSMRSGGGKHGGNGTRRTTPEGSFAM